MVTSHPTFCPPQFYAASLFAILLAAPRCSAPRSPLPPACEVIYRGPDAFDAARPFVKVLRCGPIETTVCRSPRPLPNPECTPP